MQDLVRILAAWALVHEVADEGWKAAVARGRELEPGELDNGPEALVDGLAALVADEKERLKREIADGDADDDASRPGDIGRKLDAMAYELSELRGRLESLQASIDAIAARDRD
jgi:hypothetical protein